MNIILDKKDTTNASIRITLEEADYQPRVEKKLKDYSKTASIKGFRPGKVPAGLLKKMYGKGILVDEVNNLLIESVDSYIKENKLSIVGDPLPNQTEAEGIDWDTQREFSFSYDIGLVPEFTYDVNKLNLTRTEVEITDKDINDSLDNLKARHGNYINPEEVGEQDLAFGGLKQIEGGEFQKENAYLFVNKLKEEAKPLFLGKKKGDVIVFDIQSIFADSDSVRLFTQIPQEEADKLAGKFELTIADIDRQVPAEMNEEFFKKVYGEDVKSEEEFKEKLTQELQKLYDKESDNRLLRDIQNQLVETTSIDLPNEFLKRWLKVSNKNLSDEEIAKEYDEFVKGLKWTIIKDKIAKDHDLKVEHEEVLEQAKNSFKEVYNFLQNDTPENESLLNQLADNFLKAEKGQNYMNTFQRVFTDKVAAFVKDQITPQVKKVSTEEFNKTEEVAS
ncbi:trigger factor [Xanthocytophaga flava]|uniref:trigger factor n=1 Tax=Xanthocytophaga flava TaxID=3048013 RepID=UPI0028D074ED|nr:trigger factor [Xanthocytophaga flavus]MDJ1467115.1 trigger factor [Xanthocytophaga flavus]